MLARQFKTFLFMIFLGILTAGFAGCRDGGGFKVKSRLDDSNSLRFGEKQTILASQGDSGVYTASLSGGGNATQEILLGDDSPYAGSSLSFPPGSLGISTDIQIEEGISIVQVASEFGLGQGISGEGLPMAVQAASGVDAIEPFTIGIAIPAAFGITNDSKFDRLVVLFKAKLASDQRYVGGVIPRSEILIENNQAKFTTKYFGVFQLAFASTVINRRLESAVASSVLTKAESSRLPSLQLSGVSPGAVFAGETVVLSGLNFRPSLVLAVSGNRVKGLKVENEISGSFVFPQAELLGAIPIVAEQDGVVQEIKIENKGVSNRPPLISLLQKSVTIEEDQSTSPFAVSITDPDSTLNCTTSLIAQSSNLALIPLSNILFSGTAPSCTVTLTPLPNMHGTALITLEVSDGVFKATETINLTVTNVNDGPTIDEIVDKTIDEDGVLGPITVMVNDIDSTLSCTNNLSFSSSNSALVPNDNIVISGAAPNCQMTITPLANQHGSTNITLTATDEFGLFAQETFKVNVRAVNDAPTISDVSDQTINEDADTGALTVVINDIDTTLTCASSFSGSSSNTALVPNDNIVFAGTAPNCTVAVTPAANENGTATITMTVTDGTSNAQDTFVVTVNAVNDAPTVSDVADQAIDEDTTTSVLAVLVNDVDNVLDCGTSLNGSSSNTTLIHSGNIVFAGTAPNCTVTVTPAANEYGTTTISLIVSDGSLPAEDTFLLTVNAVNDAPTISDVSDQAINEDGNTGALAVVINDFDSPLDCSTSLSGSSSNTTIIPNDNIVFAGSAPNCTVTVTPAANENGTATITMTVSDGSLTAEDTFLLTVNAVNDAPTISDVVDQTIDEDNNTGALPVVINDIDNVLDCGTSLSGSSSDTDLVPNGSIVFSGTAPNCTVMVTPAADANVSATITLTVSDGSLTAQDTFLLTVNPINDPPVIGPLTNESILSNASISKNITINDIDSVLACNTSLSATSSNQTLVPTANITFTGTAPNCVANISPSANAYGIATITILVNDGTLNDQTTFDLTVDVRNLHEVMPSVSLTVDQNRLNIEKGGNPKSLNIMLDETPSEPLAIDYKLFGKSRDRFAEVFQGLELDNKIIVPAGAASISFDLTLSGSSTLSTSGHIALALRGANQPVVDLGLYQLDSRNFDQISAGYNHSCGIRSGSLYCWGRDGMGQLGNGAGTANVLEPQKIGTSTNWQAISAGFKFTCGIDGGKLYCWGMNNLGQVGKGSTSLSEDVPVWIGLSNLWTKIAAGNDHACGIDNGRLFCWGNNAFAQLGNGTQTGQILSPMQIGSATSWTELAVGSQHSCGIQSPGYLYCWGNNEDGRLGDNTTQLQVDPVAVSGPGPYWSSAALGSMHSCGINSGVLYCWGSNGFGQIGNNVTPGGSYSTPQQVSGPSSWSQVAAGGSSTCGITSGDEKLYCWGHNLSGQLGLGSEISGYSAPQQVGNSAWNQVAAGSQHACAISDNNKFQCWGSDEFDQLGNGVGTGISLDPHPLGFGATWSELSAGYFHSCGIDSGELYCWGKNNRGQLGIGSFSDKSTVPVKVGSLGNWTSVGVGFEHTCGIESAKLYCWGANQFGQLGNGTVNVDYHTPLLIDGVTSWTKITAGYNHTCGIKSNDLFCWGAAEFGKLGNVQSIGNFPSPLPIDDSGVWTSISAGYIHTCGVKDGALFCWGKDDFGQVGNGVTTGDILVPQQVGSSSGWTAVSAGHYHSCGVDSGNLYCWGRDTNQQLGNGAMTSDVTEPVQIGIFSTWSEVSAGRDQTCGINSGALYCWGSHLLGQLGLGVAFISQDSPQQVGSSTSWTRISAGSNFTLGIENNLLQMWGTNKDGAIGLVFQNNTPGSP